LPQELFKCVILEFVSTGFAKKKDKNGLYWQPDSDNNTSIWPMYTSNKLVTLSQSVSMMIKEKGFNNATTLPMANSLTVI